MQPAPGHRVCPRCDGRGRHNLVPEAWMRLKRAGKLPASCGLCEGAGALPPRPSEDLAHVRCIFIFQAGEELTAFFPPRTLPDAGATVEYGRNGRTGTFRYSYNDGDIRMFREVTELRLVASRI